MWPKTALLLPVWPRDAHRLDTPARPRRATPGAPTWVQDQLHLKNPSLTAEH